MAAPHQHQVTVEAVLQYHDKQYAVAGSVNTQPKLSSVDESDSSVPPYPKLEEESRFSTTTTTTASKPIRPQSPDDAVISKPPPTAWHESQKVCKRLGKTSGAVGLYLMASGAYTLNRELFPLTGVWRSTSLRTISQFLVKRFPRAMLLAGSAGIAACIYFHWKRYYKDPEAIKQYRKVFFSGSFLEGLERFGWDELFLIATKDELEQHLRIESRNVLSYYAYLQKYKVENVDNFLHHGLLTPTSLEVLFEHDCTQSKLKGIELGKVIQEYGKFLVGHTSYELSQINHKLESDPHMIRDSLVTLLDKYHQSLAWMLQLGFLSHEYLHGKAIQAISARLIDFPVLAENKWILDMRVCTPAEVAGLLTSTRDSQDFTKFIDKYWDWPISKYNRELFPHSPLEYDKMASLNSEYRSKQELSVRKMSEITRAYKEEKQGIRRDLERRQAQIKDKYFTKKTKVQYTAERSAIIEGIEAKKSVKLQAVADDIAPRLRQAKAKRTQDVERVKTEFQEECIKINKEWSTWIMQHRYNLSTPALQQPQPVYIAPLPTIIINNNGGPAYSYQPQQPDYSYSPANLQHQNPQNPQNLPPPYNPGSTPSAPPM